MVTEEVKARLQSFVYQLAGFAVVLLTFVATIVVEERYRPYVLLLLSLPAIGGFWVFRLAVEPFSFSPYSATEAWLERNCKKPKYWTVVATLSGFSVFLVILRQPLLGGLLSAVPAIMTGIGVGSLLFLPRGRLGVPQVPASFRAIPTGGAVLLLGFGVVATVGLAFALSLPLFARIVLLANGALMLLGAGLLLRTRRTRAETSG